MINHGDQFFSEDAVFEGDLSQQKEIAVKMWGKGGSYRGNQYVQRPWGRTVLDVLEEQQGSLVSGAEGLRREEGGGEDRKGTGQGLQVWEDVALENIESSLGVLEDCG